MDCGLWFYEPKIAFVLDFRISNTKIGSLLALLLDRQKMHKSHITSNMNDLSLLRCQGDGYLLRNVGWIDTDDLLRYFQSYRSLSEY